MAFFDDYTRFYATSQTSPWPHRLNSRHTAIIERCKTEYIGRTVLDIASHDGRWSFAALKAGAAHVTGVEPRQELIDNAAETMAIYGVDENRYKFISGGIFDHIDERSFDVVLCLGFFYHTIRHVELLDRIERTGAKFVVIDTEVATSSHDGGVVDLGFGRLASGDQNGMQLILDPVDNEQMAWSDAMTRNGRTLVGRPSPAAIEFMAAHFGFTCERYDWKSHFRSHPEAAETMNDYADSWRETFFLRR